MVRPPTRTWTLLAVAVLAAGLGLGGGAAGAGDRQAAGGRVGPLSLATSPGAPLEAIVPVDVARVLVGRLGNTPDESRAGLLAALLFGVLLLPALAALGSTRVPAHSAWLSPERHSVALRAPPRLRLD